MNLLMKSVRCSAYIFVFAEYWKSITVSLVAVVDHRCGARSARTERACAPEHPRARSSRPRPARSRPGLPRQRAHRGAAGGEHVVVVAPGVVVTREAPRDVRRGGRRAAPPA